MTRDVLRKILAAASDYAAKHTDIDCEAKLDTVDWEREKILLFVGRLIVSKGVHGVLVALPSILAQQPDTRLIVVGHGPLREPLEAMLFALDTGNRGLFQKIVSWGRYLEGAEKSESMEHVRCYLEQLKRGGTLDAYFDAAQKAHVSNRVIFTGYLTLRKKAKRLTF